MGEILLFGGKMADRDEILIRRAIAIAASARANGNHPFGALLANEQGEIVLESENTVNTEKDCTGHAETNLIRVASKKFDAATLATLTLYTSTEPCAMCAGAFYWSGLKKLVYGLRESELYKLTGTNEDNLTLDFPCTEVFARGQRQIEVRGPILEDEAREVHKGFW